ncbi:MAG: hypothetical protein WEC59_05535 [Salibacteraceae bacterium]
MVKKIIIVLGLIFGALSFESCNNACRDKQCINESFCSDGECLCKKWYSGESCELLFNRNFSGTYYGTFNVENGSRMRTTDSIVVQNDPIIPNRLYVEDRYYFDLENDSSLIIPEQKVYGEDTFTISGDGKHDVNHLELYYTKSYVDGTASTEVSFIGDRVEK